MSPGPAPRFEREDEERRECEECSFAGSVVVYTANDTQSWVCPRCGEEHTDTHEEDPDVWHDQMREDGWCD